MKIYSITHIPLAAKKRTRCAAKINIHQIFTLLSKRAHWTPVAAGTRDLFNLKWKFRSIREKIDPVWCRQTNCIRWMERRGTVEVCLHSKKAYEWTREVKKSLSDLQDGLMFSSCWSWKRNLFVVNIRGASDLFEATKCIKQKKLKQYSQMEIMFDPTQNSWSRSKSSWKNLRMPQVGSVQNSCKVQTRLLHNPDQNTWKIIVHRSKLVSWRIFSRILVESWEKFWVNLESMNSELNFCRILCRVHT